MRRANTDERQQERRRKEQLIVFNAARCGAESGLIYSASPSLWPKMIRRFIGYNWSVAEAATTPSAVTNDIESVRSVARRPQLLSCEQTDSSEPKAGEKSIDQAPANNAEAE